MTKQHSSTHLNDLIANPFSTKEATDSTKTPAKQDNSPVLSKKTYDNLSKDNQHHAQEIAQKLTNTDYESVMHYGAAAQEKNWRVLPCSSKTCSNARNRTHRRNLK